MKRVYENQAIGKFAFDLGHYVGSKRKKSFGTINIFQQTPLDPALSDIFIGMESRFFLLEFKMKNKEKSESKKKGIRSHIFGKLSTSHLKKVCKKLSPEYAVWAEVSADCHWAAITDGKDTCFKPYLESIHPLKLTAQKIPFLTYSSNYEFIEDGIFSTKILPVGLSRSQFKEYLNWLFSAYPASKKKSDTVFFCFAVDNGNLIWSVGQTVNDFFTNVFDKPNVQVPVIK